MIIGIIGCGGIAHAHVLAISQIKQIKGLAFYDINRNNMLNLKKIATLPVTLCENIEQLAKASNAFVICTPNNLHFSLAKEVLHYNRIPLLCEKPLSTNFELASKLVEISPPKSIVSFNYRYNRIVKKILFLKDSKKLGKLVFFSADFNKNSALTRNYLTWRDSEQQNKSSGALGDLSCHLIDLFHIFSESKTDINQLKVVKGTRVKTKEGGYVEVDDNGYIFGSSVNNAFFRLHASKSETVDSLGLHLNLIFEKGEIRYSTRNINTIYLFKFDKKEVVEILLSEKRIISDPPKELPFWADSFIYLYRDWCQLLKNSECSKLVPKITEGLYIQKIIEEF
ncbi:NTD biosynthesis operon oxidoreductase ntdC [Rodentibacter ratti]|uniref:NTD biosynthesis operon oxidoreductase ntdC n=3 Tax=Rodentibacter TaxID=1960084 RepID=A0A1V3J6Q0_9PAST|nr:MULTISPECIES: Gfo/Idh/MocA family oxidoreductase [Rodentibacter]OOF42410.1 NTD biosynthesis operon oxidoreductase ntdC [Rodentibacter trehalosifermentans]OOF50823.1 NTD biosynthesis operon oxidoreductase ntdC [Rodentibacter trehalosifermentans]OOF74763.1 NTD biosynthesis operon oxidoreductase ntdC [Rodentibacter heylii]OOF80472.1 NTD biosynthesis operon oxidoreductase ntdC [Rodentibacter ratti]QIA76759.1 Gfo/Idh/MocA family oxidoreductase [Rodentibacter heylii]